MGFVPITHATTGTKAFRDEKGLGYACDQIDKWLAEPRETLIVIQGMAIDSYSAGVDIVVWFHEQEKESVGRIIPAWEKKKCPSVKSAEPQSSGSGPSEE